MLSPDVRVDGFRFSSKEFRQDIMLQLKQGGRVLFEKRVKWLKANVALSLEGGWVDKVNYAGEAIKLVIQP